MKYIELKVNIPKTICDEFTEFLDSLEVEGYYEILFDSSLPKKSGELFREDTNIRVYLGEEDFDKEIKIRIYLKAESPDNSFIESRIIETKEFEEAYKEFYKPFLIGNSFWIVPIWEKDSEQNLEITSNQNHRILYMNPGLAFGTGHHETTKLMLKRMEEILKESSRVLDLGTGSGILSIGAATLGAKEITAIDIDPNAVRATEYNWKENFFDESIQFELLEGSIDHPSIHSKEYDLILANITFAVISNNIKFIKKLKTKKLLFSGLITEREQDSLNLFQDVLGGRLIYKEILNDWLVIEWEKD
jgi:ribosomal protein L11 methyltransferase